MILKLHPSDVYYTSDQIPYIYGELETPVEEVVAYLKKYMDSDPCCLPFIEIYSLGKKYYTMFNSGLYILKELQDTAYLSRTYFKYKGKVKSHPLKFSSLNGGNSVTIDESDIGYILSEDDGSSTSDESDTSSYDSEEEFDNDHSADEGDGEEGDDDGGSGASSDGDDDESLGEIPGFTDQGGEGGDDGDTDQDDDDEDGSVGESADEFELSSEPE